MYPFKLRIAGYVIQVETQHIRTSAICHHFLTDGTPDFSLRIEQQDIDAEKEKMIRSDGDCTLWDSSLEVLAFFTRLTERLIDEGTLLMHGAVIALDGQAYLFTAPSGTGKTTHIMQWLDHCPDAFVVNGDKPFIRFSGDGTPPLACGSPWAGKEGLTSRAAVPLKAIVLLERAENNHIDPISFTEAFPTLLRQTYHPEDPEKMRKTLQLLRRLTPAVSFWRFRCNNFKDDCFPTAYRALTGREP